MGTTADGGMDQSDVSITVLWFFESADLGRCLPILAAILVSPARCRGCCLEFTVSQGRSIFGPGVCMRYRDSLNARS
jgi:hypothetical protein